jgi:hypothetical protein
VVLLNQVVRLIGVFTCVVLVGVKHFLILYLATETPVFVRKVECFHLVSVIGSEHQVNLFVVIPTLQSESEIVPDRGCHLNPDLVSEFSSIKLFFTCLKKTFVK